MEERRHTAKVITTVIGTGISIGKCCGHIVWCHLTHHLLRAFSALPVASVNPVPPVFSQGTSLNQAISWSVSVPSHTSSKVRDYVTSLSCQFPDISALLAALYSACGAGNHSGIMHLWSLRASWHTVVLGLQEDPQTQHNIPGSPIYTAQCKAKSAMGNPSLVQQHGAKPPLPFKTQPAVF